VVLGLPVLLYFTRAQVLLPLAIRYAEGSLAAQLGIELELQGITGSLFGDVRIEGLSVRRKSGDLVLETLEGARIEAEYSLLALARGESDWLRHVAVAADRVVIDLSQPAAPDATPEESEAAPLTLPAHLPSVRVDIAQVLVRLPAGERVTLEDLALAIAPGDTAERVTLSLARYRIEGPEREPFESDLALDAAYAGGKLAIDTIRLGEELEGRDAHVDLTGLADGHLDWDVQLELCSGTAALAGEVDGSRLALTARVDGVDLARVATLLPFAGLATLRGRLSFDGTAALDLDAPFAGEADLALTLEEAGYDTYEVVRLKTRVTLQDGVLQVADLVADAGPNHLEILELAARMADDTHELDLRGATGSLVIEVRDLPRLLGHETPDEGALPHMIRLAVNVSEEGITLREGRVETAGGSFEARRGRLVWGTEPGEHFTGAELELEFVADFDDLDDFGPLLGTEPWGGSLRGDLAITGRLSDLSASLVAECESMSAAGWELGTLTIDASLSMPDGRFRAESIELTGDVGHLLATVEVVDGTTDLDVTLDNLEPMKLLAPFMPAGWLIEGAHGTLQARFGESDIELVTKLEVARFRPGAGLPELALAIDAELTDKRVRIANLQVWRGDESVLRLSGEAPLDLGGPVLLAPGELALALEGTESDLAPWAGADLDLAGSVGYSANLSGTWAALRGAIHVQVRELVKGAPEDPVESRIGPVSLDLDLELGDTIRLARGTIDYPERCEVSMEGEIATGLNLVELIEDGTAALFEAPLDARGDFALHDTQWIAKLPATRRLEGDWSGDFEVGGTLAEPDPQGRVVIERGALRFTDAFPVIQAIEAEVHLLPDGLIIDRLRGEFGASPFELGGGATWAGDTFGLDITLKGENLLLYRAGGIKVRADLELAIEGPVDALHTTGAVVLTDGRFVKQFDLLGGLLAPGGGPSSGERGFHLTFAREGPLATMTFDVTLGCSAPFVIKNNVASGSLRPELRLTGTGAIPILTGLIYVEPIRLTLPSGRLTIRSGTIQFHEDDPFVPKLQLSADARIKGFDIDMVVTGDYDEPVVVLSSNPPLPSADLPVLLLTGNLPQGAMSADAGRSVAVYLAQDFLSRWLSDESTDADETVIDRIDLQLGTNVSESGADTMEASYRLTERRRGPGRTDYIAAERDIYDRFNFGYKIVFRFR